jgi:hypothetical protein
MVSIDAEVGAIKRDPLELHAAPIPKRTSSQVRVTPQMTHGV